MRRHKELVDWIVFDFFFHCIRLHVSTPSHMWSCVRERIIFSSFGAVLKTGGEWANSQQCERILISCLVSFLLIVVDRSEAFRTERAPFCHYCDFCFVCVYKQHCEQNRKKKYRGIYQIVSFEQKTKSIPTISETNKWLYTSIYDDEVHNNSV